MLLVVSGKRAECEAKEKRKKAKTGNRVKSAEGEKAHRNIMSVDVLAFILSY